MGSDILTFKENLLRTTTFGKTVLGIAAVTCMLVAGATSATAAPAVDAFTEARSFLSQYGVDAQTQDALIASYEAGESWDSFSSDSVPVTTTSSIKGGFQEDISHYADGSVSVTRIEQAKKPGVSTRSSPRGCTVSGSNRNNCTVDTWVGLIRLSFKASYNVSTNTVTNVYGAGWQIGGACSASLVYLGKPAKNIGRMDVNAQMCGVPYNSTFFLAVTLKRGVATKSWG